MTDYKVYRIQYWEKTGVVDGRENGFTREAIAVAKSVEKAMEAFGKEPAIEVRLVELQTCVGYFSP